MDLLLTGKHDGGMQYRSCPPTIASSPLADELLDGILTDFDSEYNWSEDDDDDHDYESQAEHTKVPVSKSSYHQSCKVMGVPQNISINKCFQLQNISLRYNLLSENHVKTLSVALMWNKTINILDLRACRISTQSCQYICEMLTHNQAIATVDLSENLLRTAGLILLTECLLINSKITNLLLDYNSFQDNDAAHILTILESNTVITQLSLRGNEFSIGAGSYLLQALTLNKSLISLDFSWNHLRMDGAVTFALGISMNDQLKELDLSWNGVGLRGCEAMAESLKSNTCLLILNLSANRITREAFQCLLEGLLANRTLTTLRIGDNPITTEGVMDFMNILVKSNPQEVMTSCEEIDFADICVGAEFSKLYSKVREERQLLIKHGSTVRQDDIVHIDLATVVHSEQPVFILFDCMRNSNLRIVDLFHAFDKDRSNSLTRQELKEGLLSMNIPLSSRALDLLIKHTDTDNDGEISLTDLMAVQKDYQKHLARKKNLEQLDRGNSPALRKERAKSGKRQH